MDRKMKAAVISAIGLVAVLVCAFALSRTRKRVAPAKGASSSASKSFEHVKGENAEDTPTGTPSVTPSKDDETGGGAFADTPDASHASDMDSREGRQERSGPSGAGQAAAGAAVEGTAGEIVDDEEEDLGALVARFNTANSMARKYFKAQKFDLAADQYGIALSLCDKLPNHEEKRTALHNNRGAAFEKAGKYALSLSECAMCLAREPAHPLARVRKSRVLEALGKPEEALSEVCAHLLLERDRFEAKAMLNPLVSFTPPTPPPNLEALLEKIAKMRAEEVLAEREQEEQAAAKEAEESGRRVKPKSKPLIKQAVTELLRSFGSMNKLERRYKGMKESALNRELEEGDGKEGSPTTKNASVERVSSLLNRAMLRLVKQSYDGAREDIFAAAEILYDLEATAGNEEIGVPGEEQAAVWEWQGTFLQLAVELDGAMKAYERAFAAMEAEGSPAPTDALIKMAYAYLDKEDKDKAKEYFHRAVEEDPEYGSVYAHLSRLEMGEGNNAEVVTLLEKALKLNKADVYSWESLAKVYAQIGDLDKAWATAKDALKANPKAEALILLKGELKYSMAASRGDSSAAREILEIFEEGIKAHPLSPVMYSSKASCLLQMMQDVPGATEALEKAVAVDPTNVTAIIQLANLKVMAAKTTEDAEAVMEIVKKAVDLSSTRQDLVDALSVLVATQGRINGATLLGRSSFG